MPQDRREFLGLLAGTITTGLLTSTALAAASANSRFKAIAFDAFPVFDPRPKAELTEKLFPGKGADLANAWRSRQFEYQWLRALSQRYADFSQATEDSLVFAAKMLKLELTEEKRRQLMDAYSNFKTWPDVMPALKSLKDSGLRLAFLSNLTAAMLNANIKSAGLEGVFEQVLSTDITRSYKPDPRAYQIGIDALRLKREEILFVASTGWDAAGAKSFGYTTFWVNRLNLPAEELGVFADAVGANLADLVSFLGR